MGLTGHKSVWGTGDVLKSCPGAVLMPGAAVFLPRTNSQGFVVPLQGFTRGPKRPLPSPSSPSPPGPRPDWWDGTRQPQAEAR